jgi:hypothetical protein
LTPQYKQAQREAWLPFAQFLGQLPGLTDLVYACINQIPACVLDALHQHLPRSRLHVRTFSLRSLYQERDQLDDIDPDEYLLATSSCLYSIRAKCKPYDTWRRFSFNLEAVERMVVSGCAPRLRRVRSAGPASPAAARNAAARLSHTRHWGAYCGRLGSRKNPR